jgi:hypothetical protein
MPSTGTSRLGGMENKNASRQHLVKDVPLGEHHEGSFRVYMRHKIQKQHEQFNSPGSGDKGSASKLFEGLVFFINGYTEPPIDELRRLIHVHGGDVDTYETSRWAPSAAEFCRFCMKSETSLDDACLPS